MQLPLLRVSAIFVRSVARRQTLASQRPYSRSTGGGTSTLYASRKTLEVLAGGITFVAASTSLFVYSRLSAKEVSEEQKSAAIRLLECYGLDGAIINRWLTTFQHSVEKFVQSHDCDSIEKKIAAAERVLHYLDAESKKDRILADVKEYLEKKWQQGTEEEYLINDAIHGSIELTPLLFQIINTPEFHRLKDVRQLGAAHYVYPGANHTRFDHSVGVCHLAGVFAKSLNGKLERDVAILDDDIQKRRLYTFDDHEVLCVKIAGLCHDLGHGPLSHMFEHRVVKRLKLKDVKDHKKCKHEVLSVDIFKRMLVENPKVLAEFVDEGLTHKHVQLIGEMINPPTDANDRTFPKRMFLYEIVANKTTGIDVDKWDYYARDCHYLGVEQDFQWRRCMLLARVVQTPKGYKEEGKLRIAFREKEHENLYGMFKTRVLLHQKAYQHKTVKAVEKMIADAFLKVQDVYMIRVDSESEGDRLLSKSIKEAVELAFHKDSEKVDLKWYMALSDSLISTIQCTDGKSANQWNQLHEAQQLLTRVKKRDLYSCSVRIPISRNANCCENHLSETKIECRQCKKDYALVKVAESLRSEDKKKQFQQDICRDLENIKPEDIWIEVVEFKLSSEDGDNPLKDVVFYTKPALQTLPEAISFEDIKKTSKLVVPQAFLEYELRVYDKREKVNRTLYDRRKLEKATEEVLKEWQQKKV